MFPKTIEFRYLKSLFINRILNLELESVDKYGYKSRFKNLLDGLGQQVAGRADQL